MPKLTKQKKAEKAHAKVFKKMEAQFKRDVKRRLDLAADEIIWQTKNLKDELYLDLLAQIEGDLEDAIDEAFDWGVDVGYEQAKKDRY